MRIPDIRAEDICEVEINYNDFRYPTILQLAPLASIRFHAFFSFSAPKKAIVLDRQIRFSGKGMWTPHLVAFSLAQAKKSKL